MTNFINLKICQKGIEPVMEVYKVSEILPKEEKFGLRNQITRTVISIPSKLAEGSSRSSQKDFKLFLEISLGSAFELETQSLIIQKLKSIKTEQIKQILNTLSEEQKMINGFINRLKN